MSEDVEIRADRWREIEVLAGASSRRAIPLLAASLSQADTHFLVAADGRPLGTSRWRRQQPTADAPHTIRIEVVQSGARQSLTPTQRFCIQALIAALNNGIKPDGPGLLVRIHESS